MQIKYSRDAYVNGIPSGITPDCTLRQVHFQLRRPGSTCSLLGPRRLVSPPTPTPLPKNNSICTPDSSKAEALREQFNTASADEYLSSIPSPGISPCDSMPNIHISLQGVKKQLDNIAVTKACGPDLISSRVLKEAACELAPIWPKFSNSRSIPVSCHRLGRTRTSRVSPKKI